MEQKYDWLCFGVFGLIRSDELHLHREELKKYGAKCTAVYFNKTKKEVLNMLNY